MVAALAVTLLLAAASAEDTFSFIDFFEGEWDMEKTLADATVVHAEYLMKRAPLGLSGQYVEGGTTMNVTVVSHAVNPSIGNFTTRRDGAEAADADITLFEYDLSVQLPANGVRVSMVRARKAAAALRGALRAHRIKCARVASRALRGALAQDADEKTMFMVTSPTTFMLTKDTKEAKISWSGKRRQPAPVAKPKSLLRRYGLQLLLIIIGLVAKQAYDAALAKADAPAGKAPGAAAPKKSKKA